MVEARPRVVLVVGGSSGIGLASAREFCRRGDRVILAARSQESLRAAARRCREGTALEVDTVVCDVTEPDEVTALVDGVVVEHGRLDVVVHSAMVMAYGEIEQLPAELFERVVDTAIKGTAHVARAVLAVFRRQHRGTLVIVNSLLGSVATPYMGAYVTAKWGQLGLARTLQLETRDERNVHVCIVSAGSVNTPIYDQAANVTGRQPSPPWPVLSPQTLGRVVVRVVDRPRRFVSIPAGPANPVIVLGFRLVPWAYDALVGPLLRLTGLRKGPAEVSAGNVLAPRPTGEGEYGRWAGLSRK
ncbi:MAG: SDR family NAD(P)-dependent oxidoreductase [Actinomycetota bacterium]|nr:SDR family NAD(P)-dependent oxidoreductase [Actinomycetota bacterium]